MLLQMPVDLQRSPVAAYAEEGDSLRFYEINPAVTSLARGEGGYFHYLEDCAVDVEVAAGDARLSLERELAEEGPTGYDVLILDEIVFCLAKGLAEFEQIKQLIETRKPQVELVLTGRGATAELIELADLVTEMKCLKHPYDSGVSARKGMEY